jgi:hypothetical protein
MGRIIFIVIATLFLTACNKNENKIDSGYFTVTFDGTTYTCTGQRASINANDVNRLSLLLGYEYISTDIGLVNLKGTYKKGDRIKVSVTKYVREEKVACPAFIPFPSILVLKEEPVK